MKKQVVELRDVFKPITGFSHVVKAGGFVFLSSQLSADLKTGKLIAGNIQEQTKRTMDNIKYLLNHCGNSMDDIVKMVIYFRNPSDRQVINKVYKQYFTSGYEPTKVSVQAPSPIPEIDIEIEATAIDQKI